METYRLIALIVILSLSVLDLSLTHYYISKYRTWQPEKPFNMMERNPLLVFLWTKMNLIIGSLVGAVIILSLNFIIIKDAHWIFIPILFVVLIFALINHFNNITLLNKLIEQYPSGHLPENIFGKVIGNN